ncbi:DUF2846 domain-containing protein [Pseudomonas typographi]|uniref:DUF2846 domain-containing protein n=1 Tax=Pseudomonas typographi TaxID=2715964 RepID=A0ABR7ZAH7_9PSED|nr:DUF2846 domain-containing protein [Pseudomonas typographi]MBD1602388.1 DUF2846 domain-containing protein [Pseudomonas typographi]
MRALAATTLLCLSLIGCASVPMADKQADAEAKKFATAQDMSRIYIYRNEYFGAAIKMPVVLDGNILGKTVAHSYLYTEVVPGPHVIAADGENTEMLKLTTKAGENVFIHQQVQMGFVSGRSGMKVVDAAEGKAGVLECEMIEPQY